VWTWLLERCLDLFGLLGRSRAAQVLALSTLVIAVAFVYRERWGLPGLMVPGLIVLFAATVARDVAKAREALWDAACSELDERKERETPLVDSALTPQTAITLHHLAQAVVAVRRGRYMVAHELLPTIDRSRLRADEMRLFEAVKAMISLGLGDVSRATRRAIVALPTGSDALDMRLGRLVITDAWNAPLRLKKITQAWGTSEATGASLSRLTQVARFRLNPAALEEVTRDEAGALAEEARAIGDEGLATELDAMVRVHAYR